MPATHLSASRLQTDLPMPCSGLPARLPARNHHTYAWPMRISGRCLPPTCQPVTFKLTYQCPAVACLPACLYPPHVCLADEEQRQACYHVEDPLQRCAIVVAGTCNNSARGKAGMQL